MEHENLLEMFDIRTSYKELPYISEGKMAKVGDYEHLHIVKARMEMQKKKSGKKGCGSTGKRGGEKFSDNLETH
jgi:hypothetical protein